VVQVDDLVQAGVLLRRVVDHEGQQPAPTGQLADGDAAALVLPGEPAGHAQPRAPAVVGDVVALEPADPVEGLVLADRVVDGERDQVAPAVAVEVGDGHAATLVLPGEPAGHVEPRGPGGDVAVGVQAPAEAVAAAVALRPVVDHQDHQVARALLVRRRHRDRDPLVLPGEPVGHVDPGRPAAGGVAGGVQPAADPEQPAVLPDGVVHHGDDQVQAAVAVQVGQRDVGALVLVGEPVGDLQPGAPAAGDLAAAVQRPADAVDAPVAAVGAVDQQHDQVLRAVAGEAADGDPATLVVPGEPVRDRPEDVHHDGSSPRMSETSGFW
jgi:hypothetical protein